MNSLFLFVEKYIFVKKNQTKMGGTISKAGLKNRNWAKCGLATEIHLRNNLLEILHNTKKDVGYTGLPEDPAALYKYFDRNRHLIGLKRSGKQLQLFPDQYELVLPSNKQEVDSQSFDITLIVALIIFLIVGCPFAETVKKAGKFRNDLKHGTLDEFKTEQLLKTKLGEIRNYLQIMLYSKIQEFDDMVNDDKFMVDIDEGLKHLSNLMKELKNDLKTNYDDKIEHSKKVLYADIIKELKPHMKGLFALCLSFFSYERHLSKRRFLDEIKDAF